ncbi:MAG: peptidoglycan DD-metalloendopeptidase family protein [Actinomycetota bacterium]|nr:peptidoglycan DD-metalloendopeptidase family protein [Actinomycetota bacterium]
MTKRRLLAVVLLLAVTILPVPGAAQDLDAARVRRAELQYRLDAATSRYAELEAKTAEIESERDVITVELSRLGGEIDVAEDRITERARVLYKRGGMDPLVTLLTTPEPQDALDRAALVVSLVRDDRAKMQVAGAKRDLAEALAARLDQRQAELDAAIEEQREASQALQRDFEEALRLEQQLEADAQRLAQEEARRRAEEEARRRAAEQAARGRPAKAGAAPGRPLPAAIPPLRGGRYACPVGQPRSFSDTWGAPRSGGRRHKGTDIMAPYGTAIYAVTDGVVDIRGYGPSAGNWLIFKGVDGSQYWYLHLQSFVASDGARVPAGTRIATNGDTGNARGTPHLHFERHPGGAGPVNPYPFLRSIC